MDQAAGEQFGTDKKDGVYRTKAIYQSILKTYSYFLSVLLVHEQASR